MIYLDSAATTLHKPPAVARTMQKALAECAGAGRGGHRAAMRSAEVLFETRLAAGRLLYISDPERVVFTGNATHALNIAIAHALPHTGGRVIVSGYEHNAVMRPLHHAQERGTDVTVVRFPPFNPDAARAAFEQALREPADLLITTQVSNVFGTVVPVAEILHMARQKDVPVIVDASQAAGVLPIQIDRLPPAFWCMPGHKALLGPQGTGLLICPPDTTVSPLIRGGTGSQSALLDMPAFLPDRLEPGTHNIPGIAGLLAGLSYLLVRGTDAIRREENGLLTAAVERLSTLPGLTLWAGGAPEHQTGVLSFNLEGMDPEHLAEKLSERGFALRAGLHCAPAAHQTVGTFPAGTVRASFSPFNTMSNIDALAEAMEAIAGKQATR